MNLIEYTALVNNRHALINFLQKTGVIQTTVVCPNCKSDCVLNGEAFQYRCHRRYLIRANKKKATRKICGFKRSAKKMTFFEGRIPLEKIAMAIGYFLLIPQPRVKFMARELTLGEGTVIEWSNFCREVCIEWSLKNSTKLGGEGKIVEIDEVRFIKGKYTGGCLTEGQWLLGGIEHDTKNIFLVPVKDRAAETLIHIIKEWIFPGTSIISDSSGAFNRLGEEGVRHLTEANLNFVNPNADDNTQSVGRIWREVRQDSLKYGTQKDHFVGYVAEYIFKCQVRSSERIGTFYNVISNMYQQKFF